MIHSKYVPFLHSVRIQQLSIIGLIICQFIKLFKITNYLESRHYIKQEFKIKIKWNQKKMLLSCKCCHTKQELSKQDLSQGQDSSTDTWGQLVLLTTTLNHKTCMNTSRQVLEKTLFAINAIFTQDNNLSWTKVEGSLLKTNATCSKCKHISSMKRLFSAETPYFRFGKIVIFSKESIDSE